MLMLVSSRVLITAAFLIFYLTACNSGGGGDSSPSGLTVTTGEFLDSAVEGLEYAYADGQSGLTDANGEYGYSNNGTVEFFIGGISLGSATAEFLMSPLNLAATTSVSNSTATNIARFLQVLDDDADPFNGIRITQQVRDLAVGETVNFAQTVTAFESDSNVQAVVDKLTGGSRDLSSVASDAAQSHLADTLMAVQAGLLDKFSGTATSTFSGCPSNAIDTISNGSITVTSVSSSYLTASGSFSANVGGATYREDFNIYGSLSVDGSISGSIDSEAYRNDVYAGSGSTSYEGKYNSRALQFNTPPQSLDWVQPGCVQNGTLIVVER